jgi:hypothetical protein
VGLPKCTGIGESTNVGWVFDFCKTYWFYAFEKIQNQIIVGFGYFEKT